MLASDHLPMRALSNGLTAEQEEAVARRSEPLLLAAGAGSGKTSVLVERFVRAVREDGVSPARILAITFTERAAHELRERVRERLKELGERVPRFASSARDTEAAFVGTFHGFCARLLRTHPLMAGLDPEFEILDEGLAGRLRDKAFKAALSEFVDGGPDAAVDLLAAYGPDRVRAMVAGVYAELRSKGQRLPRLPVPRLQAQADASDREGAQACALLGQLLEGFGRSYEELKRERGAVDFDDLELRARELLGERESVRRAWSERFELLMVDEFQDTNPRQLAILAALERGNLFTVGDERQAIYGFRHADVSLFRDRRAQLALQGGSLELARNFRSRRPLLDVVNAVFVQRFGPGFTPLEAGRSDEEADRNGNGSGEADGNGNGAASRARDGDGDPLIELLLTDTRGWPLDGEHAQAVAGERMPRATVWRQAEARMLAQRVAELLSGGEARAGDVVVLLRAVGDVEVYECALRDCGLRTLAAVGGFWGRREVGDLLSYLRTLANPLDESALYATLASPLVGCSSDALALLARAAKARGSGRAWETLTRGGEDLYERLRAADRDALIEFADRLTDERRAASTQTISCVLERAIHASRYREHVSALEWGERRLANVHKLLGLARRFEAREGRDLRGFLDYASHLKDSMGMGEADAPVAGDEPDAVRLMTIHAAKGLEFPVVCVGDLGRAQNTSVPDLLVDGGRIGVRLVRLDGSEATPTLDFEALSEERNRAQAEEEERILYVAMTRARERLLLSGGVNFERWPEERLRAPTISWLGPALGAELPALTATLEQPVCDLVVAGATGHASVRCRLNAPATVGTVLGRRAPRGDAREGGAGDDLPTSSQRAPSSIRVGTNAHAPREQQQQQSLPLDFGEDESPGAGSGARESHGAASGVGESRGARFGVGDSLSYTALSELERCGYRYYLERVLRLRESRPQARARSSEDGIQARVRGTLVHRLLESVDYARPGVPSSEELTLLARELGVRVGSREREEITVLVGAVSSAAASRSGPAARVAGAKSVHVEHPFAFSLGPDEPLISGVIDLLAREDGGGCLLIDYKSDRVGPQEDLRALVARDYEIQRLVYALAVLRDGAPAVEVVHWFLERPQEWVGARYEAGDRGELEERLRARIRGARARMFEVSEHPWRGLCETCPGRAGLCSWSEQETLRETPAG